MVVPYNSYDPSSTVALDLSDVQYCPCPSPPTEGVDRFLQDAAAAAAATTNGTTSATSDADSAGEGGDADPPLVVWQVVYASVVLFFMFAALISDRIGADAVMLATLTAFMVAGVITVSEGMDGFSNEGLWTVLILVVVADGISKTGALDW